MEAMEKSQSLGVMAKKVRLVASQLATWLKNSVMQFLRYPVDKETHILGQDVRQNTNY